MPEELVAVVGEIFPPFLDAARFVKHSTSAFIYSTATGELLSSREPSYHVYFAAANASDLPRFGKALFQRLWLAGYGYGRLSESGSFLKRGPIDAAVFSPERCDFVAGAVLGDGLEQRLPPGQYVPGDYLDTEQLPDLQNG